MSEATIWQTLRAKGFSETATAAIMGNMQGESGLVSYRLQGDFGSGYTRSREYTDKVDSGQITKNEFLYNGPGGGGYGLCQWTFWSRKEGLYDLAKSRGLSVGDESVQIDWLYKEMQKPEYIYEKNYYERCQVFDFLHRDESLLEMTKAVLRAYEKPADQSDYVAEMRASWGRDIYNRNAGSVPDVDPTPEPVPDPAPDPTPAEGVVPPVLKYGDKDWYKGGDKGVAVAMLQMGLKKKDISIGIWGCDGHFGKDTETAVKKFQSSCNLIVDGIVGYDTWQVLFQ